MQRNSSDDEYDQRNSSHEEEDDHHHRRQTPFGKNLMSSMLKVVSKYEDDVKSVFITEKTRGEKIRKLKFVEALWSQLRQNIESIEKEYDQLQDYKMRREAAKFSGEKFTEKEPTLVTINQAINFAASKVQANSNMDAAKVLSEMTKTKKIGALINILRNGEIPQVDETFTGNLKVSVSAKK